ncbi:IS3 family transposase [Sinanaerobacter chloroacetimidivorans]|uniref:IS3 family transposase n=1 Tax=Sinanaerobacter chloroacetimidivorans TaxID=2818044 RepID=A0A8J7W0L1_9FIRM|nr:IS3 family transposase [Sinanaerobacter chloroacetimidivorans]MBR0598589.1 IS3 family transposase [Sinanaerobacter chloroacetimidivorans]
MKLSKEEKYQLVQRYLNGGLATDICMEAGIARSTFYDWIRPYKVANSDVEYAVSASESAKMKQYITKLEQKIEVLQKVNCTVSAPLKEKLHALAQLHGQYRVHVLCEALNVDRGTFYNHIFRSKKDNNSYQFRRNQLSELIRQVYEENDQIYGAKKIRAVLSERGVAVSDKMVAELMQEMNLHSIRNYAKQDYLQFKEKKKTDHLKMRFSVHAPNQVWVSDVTYYKHESRFQYICAIIDLYARKVVAHKISQKHSSQLITATFKQAYSSRRPEAGLIFHSDRGVQYTSHAFQNLLKNCGVIQSFSPSGRPQHNAVMESFFSTMKREELYRTNYHSLNELKERVERFINRYNNERPHITLNYKTPNAHERLFFKKQEKQ